VADKIAAMSAVAIMLEDGEVILISYQIVE